MDRYIFSEIISWKTRRRRKPLLLRGARQVGKTWLVEKLANEGFDHFLKVDFEENTELVSLFEGDLNPQNIFTELELRTGINIVTGKTLLFFDEIQICPRAIMALRYFYEKMPELHVIAAGSLLEFALSEISFPVGRIQSLEIHPMNFAEYLSALGYRKAADICNGPIMEVSESTHNFLIKQLRLFWLLGGMPECIEEYIKTNSIIQVAEVQDEICDTYRMDFGKYKPKTDVYCLGTVFSGIAANVGQQIKYTGLAKDYTIPTIKKAYDSLVIARIISNAILMENSYCPLSYRSVKASDYKKAMLLFYEQNNITEFKRIFISQCEYAVNKYFNLDPEVVE